MQANPIKILFTGDLALTGSAESNGKNDYTLTISDEIINLFKESDLNIVNLETPLTSVETKILKTGPHIKAHPDSIKLLKDLHVDIACLSNNHIRDYGDQGVNETIKVCNDNGIKTVGAGKDLDDATKPLILNVGVRKIGILNFSESEFNFATKTRPGSNPDDPIHIWQSLYSLKGKVDNIVVVIHGGREMHPYPTPYQVDLYRFIVDSGADAVVGHHTHVIGGWELYKSKYIFYSIGNFVFDDPGNDPSWFKGGVIQLLIDESGKINFHFGLVHLEGKELKLIKPPKLISTEVNNEIFKHINIHEVTKEWNSLVKKSALRKAKYLLNYSISKRILNKLGLLRLSKNDKNALRKLSNQMRCRTHLDFNIDSIDELLEKN